MVPLPKLENGLCDVCARRIIGCLVSDVAGDMDMWWVEGLWLDSSFNTVLLWELARGYKIDLYIQEKDWVVPNYFYFYFMKIRTTGGEKQTK